ncbi:MAG: hypothetical protein AAF630_07015 [Cyanobacteria bacterium P01_C01_bin.38]
MLIDLLFLREHPKCVKTLSVIASGTKWNDAFSEAAAHRNTLRLLHFVCPIGHASLTQ